MIAFVPHAGRAAASVKVLRTVDRIRRAVLSCPSAAGAQRLLLPTDLGQGGPKLFDLSHLNIPLGPQLLDLVSQEHDHVPEIVAALDQGTGARVRLNARKRANNMSFFHGLLPPHRRDVRGFRRATGRRQMSEFPSCLALPPLRPGLPA